jgi:hypothetical protein
VFVSLYSCLLLSFISGCLPLFQYLLFSVIVSLYFNIFFYQWLFPFISISSFISGCLPLFQYLLFISGCLPLFQYNYITSVFHWNVTIWYDWLWSGHMNIKEMFYIPIKLKPELARASMTTSDVNNQWRSNFQQQII